MGKPTFRANLVHAVLFTVSLISSLTISEVAKAETYGVINLAGHHVNTDLKFNEQNLGLGLGFYTGDVWRVGAEIGFYENSFNETTTYAAGFVNARVGDVAGHDIRLGAFVGLFEYPNLVLAVQEFGIPTFGDYVPQAGLTASVDIGSGWDVRMQVVPAGGNPDAVAALQIGKEF